MKKLISVTALILSFETAQADQLASRVTSLHNSFTSHLRLQEMQMNSIQNLMNEISTKRASLHQSTAYTVRSGQLNLELNTLVNRLQEHTRSFSSGSARVTMDAKAADDVVSARRAQYHQQLRNLSAMDATTLNNMRLPAEIRHDVELMRNIKDLPPDQQNQRMRQYEGRTFGESISRPDQLRGMTRAGEVKLTSGEVGRTVALKVGQNLTIQTPSGGVVRGNVMGVLPGGRVVIENIWPNELARLQNLSSQPGRIIDLNAASTVRVDHVSQTRPTEYNVRYTTQQITSYIRSGQLRELAMRSRSAGPTVSVVPHVIDKVTGHSMGMGAMR